MSEKIFTDDNFKQDVLNQKGLVLVDFWAEWCGPCKMLAPVIGKIAQANAGKVMVGKLNVDDNPETPQQYGIQGIPTLLFFKDGKLAQQVVGFQSQENIQRMINELQ
jgi:thioredoxin 1